MLTTFLIYLLKSTVCILAFGILYKIFLSQLTDFKWTRGFLISGLILSLILPLYPILTPVDAIQPAPLSYFTYNFTDLEMSGSSKTPHESSGSFYSFIPLILIVAYGIGAIFTYGF